MRRLFSQRRLAHDDARIRLPRALLALAPFAVKRDAQNGRRLVVRVVLWQTGCAVIVAALCSAAFGAAGALAGLAGGLIAAIGSALFGWRMFAPGIAAASVLRRAMFAAEALKWFWYVLGIWVALVELKLMPLPLLIGLIAAQFGYWFGMILIKRG
jgi:F0F1-type ATP synthase assembly protein I